MLSPEADGPAFRACLLECVTTIVHPSFKNLGFTGWGIFGVVSILQITGGEFWGEFLPISWRVFLRICEENRV